MPKSFKDGTGMAIGLVGIAMFSASLLAFIIGGSVGGPPESYCVPGSIFFIIGSIFLGLGSVFHITIDEVTKTVTTYKLRAFYFKTEERTDPLSRLVGARLNYGYSANRDSRGHYTGTSTLVASASLVWSDGSETSVQCGQDNCYMDRKQAFVDGINLYLDQIRAGAAGGGGGGGRDASVSVDTSAGGGDAVDHTAVFNGSGGVYQPPQMQHQPPTQRQPQHQTPFSQYLQQQQMAQHQQQQQAAAAAAVMYSQQQQMLMIQHQQMIIAAHQNQQQHNQPPPSQPQPQQFQPSAPPLVPTGSVPIVPIPQLTTTGTDTGAGTGGGGFQLPLPDMMSQTSPVVNGGGAQHPGYTQLQ